MVSETRTYIDARHPAEKSANPEKSNFASTSLAAGNNTRTVTVPSSKRWIVDHGRAVNPDAASRRIQVFIGDAGSNTVGIFEDATIVAGFAAIFPGSVEQNYASNFGQSITPVLRLLDSSWTISILWVGMTGGNSSNNSIIILELIPT